MHEITESLWFNYRHYRQLDPFLNDWAIRPSVNTRWKPRIFANSTITSWKNDLSQLGSSREEGIKWRVSSITTMVTLLLIGDVARALERVTSLILILSNKLCARMLKPYCVQFTLWTMPFNCFRWKEKRLIAYYTFSYLLRDEYSHTYTSSSSPIENKDTWTGRMATSIPNKAYEKRRLLNCFNDFTFHLIAFVDMRRSLVIFENVLNVQ